MRRCRLSSDVVVMAPDEEHTIRQLLGLDTGQKVTWAVPRAAEDGGDCSRHGVTVDTGSGGSVTFDLFPRGSESAYWRRGVHLDVCVRPPERLATDDELSQTSALLTMVGKGFEAREAAWGSAVAELLRGQPTGLDVLQGAAKSTASSPGSDRSSGAHRRPLVEAPRSLGSVPAPAGQAPDHDIDLFLSGFTQTVALRSALQLGLIDLLCHGDLRDLAEVSDTLGLDPGGLEILVRILVEAQVLARTGQEVRLTTRFLALLPHRCFLEAKMEEQLRTARDLLEHSTTLFADPKEFGRRSGLHDRWVFPLDSEPTEEVLDRVWQWMRTTTITTRQEAPLLLDSHDLSGYRRMLEIGGNSGELALQACRRYPDLEVVIMDLPAVCEIGRAHVAGEPEADRISFQPGNAFEDPPEGSFDLVVIKSALHDWTEENVLKVLGNAKLALEKGGALVIMERGYPDSSEMLSPFTRLPLLPYLSALRSPHQYVAWLSALGFGQLEIKRCRVDLPFMILSAVLEQ